MMFLKQKSAHKDGVAFKFSMLDELKAMIRAQSELIRKMVNQDLYSEENLYSALKPELDIITTKIIKQSITIQVALETDEAIRLKDFKFGNTYD